MRLCMEDGVIVKQKAAFDNSEEDTSPNLTPLFRLFVRLDLFPNCPHYHRRQEPNYN